MANPPNVLVFSGHDPSGGAGLQADVEAIGACGAHPAVVVTALTRQDSRNAHEVWPVAPDRFCATLDSLAADLAFAAIKVGLVGSCAQVKAIAAFADTHPDIPLVLDPVLRAGGGATLANEPVAQALTQTLFPRTTLLTPNAAEARSLCSGENDLTTCGQALSRQARHVLVTGGDEPGDWVVNRLFANGALAQEFRFPKLAGPFHGAGCTLAAAICARLANGESVATAANAAQSYVHKCLAAGFAPGRGR
ncbi:MAG: hydroxymethylpyrimidine/phosphomethylpyrimidine kinase, partial [Salinisphaera sp.]|nr:hydroxymethylpyrimidine/phosphomethylpyrimidine kinase [Salinisphaera sp.]